MLDWTVILTYKELILGLFVLIGGVVTALLTLYGVLHQSRRSAEQSFRDDLIELFETQQKQIEALSLEMQKLRKENIETLEKNAMLVNERAKDNARIVDLEIENKRLTRTVQELQDDKARLANQIMMMQEELHTLRKLVVNQPPVQNIINTGNTQS